MTVEDEKLKAKLKILVPRATDVVQKIVEGQIRPTECITRTLAINRKELEQMTIEQLIIIVRKLAEASRSAFLSLVCRINTRCLATDITIGK